MLGRSYSQRHLKKNKTKGKENYADTTCNARSLVSPFAPLNNFITSSIWGKVSNV